MIFFFPYSGIAMIYMFDTEFQGQENKSLISKEVGSEIAPQRG